MKIYSYLVLTLIASVIYIIFKLKNRAIKKFYRKGYMMKNNKKKNEITIRSSAAEYLTYVAAVGDDKDSIEVRYEDENIWLTQKMLATVYGVNIATINEHIKNIYKDNELEEDSTIRKFLIVQKEGNREVSRELAFYSLDAIIEVGYYDSMDSKKKK